MEDILDIITGLTTKERKKLLTWVASLPEEKTIEIFHNGVKKSYQLKQERPDIPGKINKYSAFIMAARKSGWDTIRGKGFRVAEEKQYEDFSHLRRARAATLIKKGRTPVLRRKIIAYWGEIKELKEEDMGFRPIADYLKSNHKLKTSATYLAKLWKEIETNV